MNENNWKMYSAVLVLSLAVTALNLSCGGCSHTGTELPGIEDAAKRTESAIESAGNAITQGRTKLENAVKRVDECERVIGESQERLTDRREIIARLKNITGRAERLIGADEPRS